MIFRTTKGKNLARVNSPLAFCFLVNLALPDDLFDSAYIFLSKYFELDFKACNKKKMLDLYFK